MLKFFVGLWKKKKKIKLFCTAHCICTQHILLCTACLRMVHFLQCCTL